MKFNHFFYDSQVNFKSISKKKIVLSIFLGLASAVLIYSFFYVLRETDRMLFFDFEERPIIVPEADRQLFSFFFAAISLILGNSIAISFLFSRPQKAFSRRNNKRNRILNDQIFLGFNFIHWFTMVWSMFATFSSQFMGSKFIANFLLPSTLLILVLYLDTWKTLSLVFKKNRWKIKMFHFVLFLILTFALSKLNFIDYKSIDEFAYEAHPTIEVPKSLYENDTYKRQYYDNLVFKVYFNSKNEPRLFNAQNKPIELYDIYKILKDNESQYPEELVSRISVRLRIDKDIPIKFVKQIELELIHYNQPNIIYETYNEDELTSRFYNNQLRHRISSSLQYEFPVLEGQPPRIPIWNPYEKGRFKDTLQLYISENIEINGLILPVNMISSALKKHINDSTLVEYIYSDRAIYQDYINVFSAHKTAAWELRGAENYDKIEESIYRNQFNRDEELNKERDRLREKYPICITEHFQ